MKTKHTPGPWIINHDTEYNRICIDDLNGNRVAPICQLSLKDTTDEYLSNAKLIAAAPEMLTELENCLVYFKYKVLNSDKNAREYYNAIESVLKKARGE